MICVQCIESWNEWIAVSLQPEWVDINYSLLGLMSHSWWSVFNVSSLEMIRLQFHLYSAYSVNLNDLFTVMESWIMWLQFLLTRPTKSLIMIFVWSLKMSRLQLHYSYSVSVTLNDLLRIVTHVSSGSFKYCIVIYLFIYF